MDKKKTPLANYSKTNVMTANRETLLLMLYDGAIRFLKQALVAVKHEKHEEKSKCIGKTMDIVTELNASLNKQENEVLANQLESLYQFIQERLLKGSMENDTHALEEALGILTTLRSAWGEAISSLK